MLICGAPPENLRGEKKGNGEGDRRERRRGEKPETLFAASVLGKSLWLCSGVDVLISIAKKNSLSPRALLIFYRYYCCYYYYCSPTAALSGCILVSFLLLLRSHFSPLSILRSTFLSLPDVQKSPFHAPGRRSPSPSRSPPPSFYLFFFSPFFFLFFYFLFCRRGPPATRSQQLSEGEEEEGSLHQNPAEGAGEGVRRQQIHHQREAEEDFGHHQPVRAPSDDLVPEPEGQREESGEQIQNSAPPPHLTSLQGRKGGWGGGGQRAASIFIRWFVWQRQHRDSADPNPLFKHRH